MDTNLTTAATQFIAPAAWVAGAWAQDVLLTVDAQGHWAAVTPNSQAHQHPRAVRLPGPVVPGLVNAHSHAFQRAIAGLTEQRASKGASQQDNFWSWRDRMYAAALKISPQQLEHIATLLYTELLAGGYTQVCEFHYLHNAASGQSPAPALDMSMALVRAAQTVGIGLTLLPTLYMRSGFAASGLRDDQQRFASSPDTLARLLEDVQAHIAPSAHINLGVAIHSLRAVDLGAMAQWVAHADRQAMPIHIHIAEQEQEVQDCLAHTGLRPIAYLLDNVAVNARWNLVHATHASGAELQGVRDRGASVVLCPSTEANLGDGIFDFGTYASCGGRWSIGSDSHVTRSASEELRSLEYAQRLLKMQRNVAAHAGPSTSSASNLWEAALAGGQSACGLPVGAIAKGQRADFLVLDTHAPALLGIPAQRVLDAWIFSSPNAPPKAVYVAGKLKVHHVTAAVSAPFVETMQSLWA